MQKNKVFLEGYEFELVDFICSGNDTSIIILVSGKGTADSALTKWILEVCPDDTNEKKKELSLVSCEKKKNGGEWIPARAQSTTYELMGDIGIAGVLVEEGVGKDKDDPDIKFRLVFSDKTASGIVRVGYMTKDDIYRSAEKIRLRTPEKIPVSPVYKNFCLYVVIPDGYKPLGACRVNISITKRGLFLVHETGTFEVNEKDGQKVSKAIKTNMIGSIKIIASLPLKSSHACGDSVEVCACDCFEICETVGYSNEDNPFEMKDIAICPVRKSFDLTLLNAHCGRSVYRLDGEYIINCKKCE